MNNTVTSPTIAVIDYQAGNIRSVSNALKKSGANVLVTSDVTEIEGADGMVFPGQGSCPTSMDSLKSNGLDKSIIKFIGSGKPFLGVCLGLQLLLDRSEEGNEDCLGVLEGNVIKLPSNQKIPHMGWNRVSLDTDHQVFKNLPTDPFFYFVHSYYAEPSDPTIVCGKTYYGIEFCSAVHYENIIAVQFHPEKSGDVGLTIYRNFVYWVNNFNLGVNQWI